MVSYYQYWPTVKLLCIIIGLMVGIFGYLLGTLYIEGQEKIYCKALGNELLNNNTEPVKALLVLNSNSCD
jgi:H+/Cl- antiporter ClcA